MLNIVKHHQKWKLGSRMHHVRYLDVKIEIYVMEKKNCIFQTQQNVVLEDEVTKLQLQKLMDQRKIWKGYN